MSHFKTISKVRTPAKAAGACFENCIDYLWNTCDVKGFVDCVSGCVAKIQPVKEVDQQV